jgi:hypothetical protein
MAEQARSKGCQGRRFQGVRGVADQISAVERCLLKGYNEGRNLNVNVYNKVCHFCGQCYA